MSNEIKECVLCGFVGKKDDFYKHEVDTKGFQEQIETIICYVCNGCIDQIVEDVKDDYDLMTYEEAVDNMSNNDPTFQYE